MTHLSDKLNELNKNNFSTRQIANLATERGHSINHATVARYLNGKHPNPPRREALEALAIALGTDIANLERAAGMTESRTPFEMPAKAATLNDAERAAILNLIDVMVASKTPSTLPGTVAGQMSAIMQGHDREAQARAQGLTPEDMAYHIGLPTPDGDPFRPNEYQDHLHLWEKYGENWREHYYALAAKRRTEDIDDPYAGRSPFLGEADV